MKKTVLSLLSFALLATTSFASSGTLQSERVVKNWAPALHDAVVATVEVAGELTEKEVHAFTALMNLQVLDETVAFEEKFRVKGIIVSLKGEPSYGHFMRAIDTVDGLESWLVTQDFLIAGSCNCQFSALHCATGYYCDKDVSCTSEAGSKASGVCASSNPDPDDPSPIG